MIAYRMQRRVQKTTKWLAGMLHWHITLRLYRLTGKQISNLNLFERRVTSQNWEDGMIHALFGVIGTTDAYYVEFGTEDGTECNTKQLTRKGWTGLLMDGRENTPESGIKQEFITAENINNLFAKYNVPTEFDLLSIDIDGNDYWVWKAIEGYSPRVVIMEYNACIPYEPAVTVPYKADFSWDKTDYYGASLSALVQLGKEKGYTLIATDCRGVNAFFVREDIAQKHFVLNAPENIFRPAMFKGKLGGHPKDLKQRPWTEV
ncbi:MAG: hypothetical protein HOG89_03485 [Candidatus Peribacter sp.]|jgi:hypothetical protein|nr:hypothetical protein [Candidatus Peribacter sp.]MBT4393144.1 hypothetical protein [Candidatus Peribacter sp.]MBT4600512.1 hypothetical protein [Candidatus Peribacter sp.]MBT5148512.1 hypothetical protein [Candidatus Peribacter sp.]MBT5638679.1 hypothetical protein [Candidatus Peribacter sp.]